MNKIKKKGNTKGGFTLIEIMVSVAIFAIVVTSGMGALTMILKTYRYSQAEKKSSDSLSYVLENMTREIRLGHNYYSGATSNSVAEESRNGGADETQGSIGFKASDDRGYIIYYVSDGVLYKKHYKKEGMFISPLTDVSQVLIKSVRITVMNAVDPYDMKQPLVWIQISAFTPNKEEETGRIIQTLVSQRDLDI